MDTNFEWNCVVSYFSGEHFLASLLHLLPSSTAFQVTTITCKLHEFPLLFCYIHGAVLVCIVAVQTLAPMKWVLISLFSCLSLVQIFKLSFKLGISTSSQFYGWFRMSNGQKPLQAKPSIFPLDFYMLRLAKCFDCGLYSRYTSLHCFRSRCGSQEHGTGYLIHIFCWLSLFFNIFYFIDTALDLHLFVCSKNNWDACLEATYW